MAERPAFFVSGNKVARKFYSFQWFSGFAASQKQKSIESLHEAIIRSDKNAKPLEISTKSKDPLGVKLSAFNLRYNGYTLENIFQSSKVFVKGGPYRDLLEVHPRDAKRDERLKTSGELKAFDLNGEIFPLMPKTLFYDYIYIKAVKESLTADEIQRINEYDHFTDIEFNPERSINTQAKTAAIIRLMLDVFGELPDINKDDFLAFHKMYVQV